jgi:hypothetical protein
MITIICDFRQFSAIFAIFGEKIGFFLKNQCYDQNFAQFAFVLSQKRQFFAQTICENILKIITSVPGVNSMNLHFGRNVPGQILIQ